MLCSAGNVILLSWVLIEINNFPKDHVAATFGAGLGVACVVDVGDQVGHLALEVSNRFAENFHQLCRGRGVTSQFPDSARLWRLRCDTVAALSVKVAPDLGEPCSWLHDPFLGRQGFPSPSATPRPECRMASCSTTSKRKGAP